MVFYLRFVILFEPDRLDFTTCINTDILFRDQQLGAAAHEFRLDLVIKEMFIKSAITK